MKNNYFLPITAIVIVFLAAYSAWFLLNNKSSQNLDLDIYKEYINEEFNFSLMYPEFMDIDEQNDSVAFVFEGSTQQPDTEGFDGIRVSFTSGNLSKSDAEDFTDFVNQEFKRDEQNAEIIQPLKPIKLSGIDGYAYRFTGLGTFTSYYLPITDNNYLFISVFTQDPTNQGFDEIVSNMLSSFTVLSS